MKQLRGHGPLLALMSAGRFLAFVARLNIVPFYPELMKRFDTTYTGAGALFSAFFLGYALSLIPAGAAADRWRPRAQMALGFVLLAISGGTVALAASFPLALAARAVEGIAVAALYTAILKLVVVVFPRESRGKAIGVMEWATGLGMLTALSALPVLSQWIGFQRLLLALPALCAGALVLFVFTASGPAAAAGPTRRPATRLRSVLGWNFAFVTVTALLGLFTVSGVLSWFPSHVTEVLGYTKAQAGLVTGVMLGGQMLGVYPAGSLSDRLGRRLPLVWVGTAILTVTLLVLVQVRSTIGIYTVALIAGLGMAISVTPLTLLSMEMFGAERAGVIAALTIAAGQAGSGLSGALFGWVLDRTGNFAAVWVTAAGLSGIRLLLASRIQERPATKAVSAAP